MDLKGKVSISDIHNAYKKKIKEYHPDKVEKIGGEIKKLAQKRTKEIIEAYEFFKKKSRRYLKEHERDFFSYHSERNAQLWLDKKISSTYRTVGVCVEQRNFTALNYLANNSLSNRKCILANCRIDVLMEMTFPQKWELYYRIIKNNDMNLIKKFNKEELLLILEDMKKKNKLKQYFDKAFSKIAVLGSGTMGGQIAAHFANLGFEVVMFDVSEEVLAKSLAVLKKLKPTPLASQSVLNLIKTSTYESMDILAQCDFIIESVVENLDIKKQLFANIAPYVNDNAVLVTNTSGLSIQKIAEHLKNVLPILLHFLDLYDESQEKK